MKRTASLGCVIDIFVAAQRAVFGLRYLCISMGWGLHDRPEVKPATTHPPVAGVRLRAGHRPRAGVGRLGATTPSVLDRGRVTRHWWSHAQMARERRRCWARHQESLTLMSHCPERGPRIPLPAPQPLQPDGRLSTRYMRWIAPSRLARNCPTCQTCFGWTGQEPDRRCSRSSSPGLRIGARPETRRPWTAPSSGTWLSRLYSSGLLRMGGQCR